MDSRLITATDLDDVADVLTNAFVTDPTGEFLFPDLATRAAGLKACRLAACGATRAR